MPSKEKHRVVPATSANCETDFRNKKKLNAEFKDFKQVFERAARSSADVKRLAVPLRRLESAILIGAHGFHLVVPKKKRGS
jgi:hypothetical protein